MPLMYKGIVGNGCLKFDALIPNEVGGGGNTNLPEQQLLKSTTYHHSRDLASSCPFEGQSTFFTACVE